MLAHVLILSLIVAIGAPPGGTELPDRIDLALHPQAVAETDSLRLLPADYELTRGNAAVVMLRMIWEQQVFITQVLPQIPELVELPYDDPRIVKDFEFGSFQRQMERAAYIRDADWNYPLDDPDQQMDSILLPDVQGFREFIGRGMWLWVGQQIARGDLDAARRGILTQLACARHLARTPLAINHMVATAIADMALDRAELLVQQPQSPNLYWALAMLPNSLGDIQAVVQWESQFIPRSLPALSRGVPDTGDDAWVEVAADYWQQMAALEMNRTLSPEEIATLQRRLKELAIQEWAEFQQLKELNVEKMSDEEVVVRWILANTHQVSNEIERAHSLPPEVALKRLKEVDAAIADRLSVTEVPLNMLVTSPVRVYLSLHRFDRRVKFLQTYEAIRNYAAGHDGELPATLDDLALPAPVDPLTGERFLYSVEGNGATLRMDFLEGIDAPVQRQRVYKIRRLE